MNAFDDPNPLGRRADLPESLSKALREEAASGPNAEQAARIAASLGIALPPPTTTPTSPPSLPPPAIAPAAGLGGWTIAIGGALVVSVIAAGGYLLASRADRATEPPTAASLDSREPVPTPPIEAPRTEPDDDIAPTEIAPAEIAEVPAVAPPEARAPRRPRREPTPIEVAAEAPAPSIDNADQLREENSLVQRAEAALNHNPQVALALANAHRSRFPSGVLVEEREVIAIDALLRLERRAEAEARARVFQAGHAQSLHARRVRRLLEATPRAP